MNLRNKKTGEIAEFIDLYVDGSVTYFRFQDKKGIFKERINSLFEFNAEWEDYELQEPLIKDEKFRKAVRAWADACNLSHVTYKQASNEFYDANTRGAFAIRFTCIPIEVYLEDGKSYTIAELCGEEA